MKFNSQICTSREQSERLLALGLKKETADMVLCEPFDYEKRKYSDGYAKIVLEEGECFCTEDIPAWGLHRLIEMIGEPYNFSDWLGKDIHGHYNDAINFIEWLIKEGYFNKEYLQEQAESRREE